MKLHLKKGKPSWLLKKEKMLTILKSLEKVRREYELQRKGVRST